MNLPGYDAWKLACPYDMTAEEEAAEEANYNEKLDDLRADLTASIEEYRCGPWRWEAARVMAEVLAKVKAAPGEPAHLNSKIDEWLKGFPK